MKILLIFIILLMTGCTTNQYKVAIASDIHYISPDICDNSMYFEKLVANGDGKVMTYIEEITNSFLNEVIEEKPDALILTGDLSFNGEKQSHIDLASKLSKVEEAGIPVYVLPGNHDLYFYQAYSFLNNSYEKTDNTTEEEFKNIYAEFGYDEALSIDEDSLSYMAKLNDSTIVLMIDTSAYENYCSFSDNTKKWIEECLQYAKKNHFSVLSCGHENLFQHSMFRDGYVIERSEELQELFRKYDVDLFLSGHMHIQHILQQNEITEICTSSLAVTPFHYGILNYKYDHYDYKATSLKIAADDKLNETAQVYMAASSPADLNTLLAKGYDEDTAKEMISYANELHKAYFAGHLRKFSKEDELYMKWISIDEGIYLKAMENDLGKDYTVWKN